jgi:hypothetical protein
MAIAHQFLVVRRSMFVRRMHISLNLNIALSFTDKYLSLTPGNPAYIGDKSFVLHYANKTRIACANFVMGNNTGNNTSRGSTGGSAPPPASTVSSSPSPSPSSSASSIRHLNNAGLLALIAAIGYAVL